MTSAPKGHVFVALGRIGTLAADAVVIPTDHPFTVERQWYDALGVTDRADVDQHRPAEWQERGWGRSPHRADTWFLDVIDATGGTEDSFGRLRDLLHDLAVAIPTSTIKNRPFPLFLVPVIGVGAGGKDAQRGKVVSRLLEVCTEFTGSHAADVAIVTPNRAAYSALQHRRARLTEAAFPDVDVTQARRIGELASQKSLALFIGAGASVPAGLPSWDDLLANLLAQTKLTDAVRAGFKELSAIDQAELLHGQLGDKMQELVRQSLVQTPPARPALAHALLAALQAEAAVTTNYDDLYERASSAAGGSSAEAVTAILPSELPTGGQRWLLKMHGTLTKPETIVLTRGQFVGFTSESGPSGAVLQSLLLTKHLLLVGTSMTDDNVLRLIHEVIGYRRRYLKSGSTPDRKFGSILEVSDQPARQALHAKNFTSVLMPGSGIEEKARALEIFLDAVGAFATKDASWLLDERFGALLTESGKGWAKGLRLIAQEMTAAGATEQDWSPFLASLNALGLTRDKSSTPTRPS